MSKLYIVGTPIGNLEDITLRALRVLKEVDVIACEDTRVTRKLLSHFEIQNKKLIAYHDKNERQSAKGIIELIKLGKTVAQVSDAGMPVVNDPGFSVIKLAIEENIDYEIIPGPSAVTTTLALSNFDTKFKFHGFLKPKTIQRQNQLKTFDEGTHIVFCSPHRLIKELEDILTVFGSDTQVFLGKELTKKFETHYRGTIEEVLSKVKEPVKGEYTLAFELKKKGNKYDK